MDHSASAKPFDSRCPYGRDYTCPKPIAAQVAILRAAFPQLGTYDETIALRPLSARMEGYFALPPWQLLAPTYNEAVVLVMAAIASSREFLNWLEGALGPRQLLETSPKQRAFQQLCAQQPGHDILIVAGQFGRAPLVKERPAEEFDFGVYEAAIMLLTHPERLSSDYNLWLGCRGDRLPEQKGAPDRNMPVFRYINDSIEFINFKMGLSSEYEGPASGIVPPGQLSL